MVHDQKILNKNLITETYHANYLRKRRRIQAKYNDIRTDDQSYNYPRKKKKILVGISKICSFTLPDY